MLNTEEFIVTSNINKASNKMKEAEVTLMKLLKTQEAKIMIPEDFLDICQAASQLYELHKHLHLIMDKINDTVPRKR